MVENCIIIERLGEVERFLPFYEFSLLKGIGRDNMDHNYFMILDPLISRYHARIEFFNGNFYLYDLGSENGTYFKPQKAQKLEINQKIFISENLSLMIQDQNLNLLVFELIDKKTKKYQSFKFEFSDKQCLFFSEDGKHSFDSDELKNIQFKIFCDDKAFYFESIAG